MLFRICFDFRETILLSGDTPRKYADKNEGMNEWKEAPRMNT